MSSQKPVIYNLTSSSNHVFFSTENTKTSQNKEFNSLSMLSDDAPLDANTLGDLPPSNMQKGETEDKISVSPSWFDALTQENENLKQRNIELMVKIKNQKRECALKEDKASELLDQLVNTERELDRINEKFESTQQENSHLKFQVKNLRIQVSSNGKSKKRRKGVKHGDVALKKKLLESTRNVDRLHRIITACHSRVATKNILMRKMETHIKHLWNYLIEFGSLIASADILKPEQKSDLLKTYEEFLSFKILHNNNETDILKTLGNLPTTCHSPNSNDGAFTPISHPDNNVTDANQTKQLSVNANQSVDYNSKSKLPIGDFPSEELNPNLNIVSQVTPIRLTDENTLGYLNTQSNKNNSCKIRKSDITGDLENLSAQNRMDESNLIELPVQQKTKDQTSNTKFQASKRIKLDDCYVILKPIESSWVSEKLNPQHQTSRNLLQIDSISEAGPSTQISLKSENRFVSEQKNRNPFFLNKVITYDKIQSKVIENSVCLVNAPIFSGSKAKSVEDYFKFVDVMQLHDKNFKENSHSLKAILSNENNYSDKAALISGIVKYLNLSKHNHLLDLVENTEERVSLPDNEDCIITALFMIESDKPPHLGRILEKSLIGMQYVIATKKMSCYGLASLCRVATEISKRKDDKATPLFLCSSLLKMKHQFAPYLIASIASVWQELFHVREDFLEEDILFHMSIAYGAMKKSNMLKRDWDISMKIISKYLNSQNVSNVRRSISLTMHFIENNCRIGEWTNVNKLASALVIFSVFEDWNWIKDILLNLYIEPNLDKFGIGRINQQAFDVFCNLYVDIFLVNPSKQPQEQVLVKFFERDVVSIGWSGIQESAAKAFMKLSQTRNIPLPKIISSWFEKNHNNPNIRAIRNV